MYQTQRLYISNCLCLWFLLLMQNFCVILCYHRFVWTTLSTLYIIIRITYSALISRRRIFFTFPDNAVDWRKLGKKGKTFAQGLN